MYQMFQGLAYLHLNNLVHRDLKPDNILLNEKNDIKITDFGWSRKIENEKDPITKLIANILYRAPEICLQVEKHDWRVDIWAIGCIFFEILQKSLFVNGDSNLECIKQIIARVGTPTPEELNFTNNISCYNLIYDMPQQPKRKASSWVSVNLCERGRNLMDACLQFDPRQRISALEAVRHSYFKEIHTESEFRKSMVNHVREDLFDFEKQDDLDKKWFLNRIILEVKDFNPPQETSIMQKFFNFFTN